MLEFSEIHPAMGEPAVMQLLVFSSQQMKDEFDKTYSIATQKHDPELVKVVLENNMGAIYKLRAVLNREGKYIPVIRCGFTGRHLVELGPVPSAKGAIALCKMRLMQLIIASTILD
jgi:hypothetical protein